MDRRELIKSLLIATGALLILPSCFTQEETLSVSLKNLNLSAEQEALLAELVDTLLPATDTPGAKELLLHLFVLKMVDDCHEKTDQEDFMSGLSLFDEQMRRHSGESFLGASAEKRTAFLRFLEENQEHPEAIRSFYGITKRRTIQGYLGSEYVLTNLLKYELVPARYNGYMPV